MVKPSDLEDAQEYDDVVADIREECSSYGNLMRIVVPKMGEPNAGKVYLEYAEMEHAQAAQGALNGRSFDSNKIQATFCEEDALA